MKKKKKIDTMKILKIVTITLGVIFVLELGYLIFAKIRLDNNTTYANAIYAGIEIADGHVTAGESDFKNSQRNQYIKEGYRKGVIAKYDKYGKLVFESKYNTGLNSKFNDVIEVTDGYIAIGSVEANSKQNTDGAPEAMIVKYDKNGILLWAKNYKNLSINSFNKVIETTNGTYLVVGSSIYLSNELGNHKTGGAILVEYDKDGNELKRVNYDGPKTGAYNDVIEVSDGYIVVGKIKAATAIIAKYDRKLEMKWRKLYGNADNNGFRAIYMIDKNNFVVGGSKVSATENTQEILLVKYDIKGNKIDEKTYSINEKSMVRDISYLNDKIIVVGNSSTSKEGDPIKSIIVTYDKDLELLEEVNIESDSTLIMISLSKNNIYGYTTSKIEEAGAKGKDIYPVIAKIDNIDRINYLELD